MFFLLFILNSTLIITGLILLMKGSLWVGLSVLFFALITSSLTIRHYRKRNQKTDSCDPLVGLDCSDATDLFKGLDCDCTP